MIPGLSLWTVITVGSPPSRDIVLSKSAKVIRRIGDTQAGVNEQNSPGARGLQFDEAELGKEGGGFGLGFFQGGFACLAEGDRVVGVTEAGESHKFAAIFGGHEFVAEGDRVGVGHSGVARGVEDDGWGHLRGHLVGHGEQARARLALPSKRLVPP